MTEFENTTSNDLSRNSGMLRASPTALTNFGDETLLMLDVEQRHPDVAGVAVCHQGPELLRSPYVQNLEMTFRVSSNDRKSANLARRIRVARESPLLLSAKILDERAAGLGRGRTNRLTHAGASSSGRCSVTSSAIGELTLADCDDRACKPEIEIRKYQCIEHDAGCCVEHDADRCEQHDSSHQSSRMRAPVPRKLERCGQDSGEHGEQRDQSLKPELDGVLEVAVVGSEWLESRTSPPTDRWSPVPLPMAGRKTQRVLCSSP